MDSQGLICLAIHFNLLSVNEFLDFNLSSDDEFLLLHFHLNSIYEEIFSCFPDRREMSFNLWAIVIAAVHYLSYLSPNPSLSDIFFYNNK
jgi:hypothetical protein